MNTLTVLLIAALWLSIGMIVQTYRKVIGGLAFAYQYSSSLRDYAEMIFMLLVAFLIWPIGCNYSFDFISRVGKLLRFQHY